jgi:hypothetical protein
MTVVPRSAALALAAALSAAALSGCEKKIEAPYDRGVCWHVVPLTGGKIKFNKLSENRPNLESCAASLEGMRERFLSLGGAQEDLVGAYQGNFLFLGRTGVFTSTSLTSARWPALVRTSDGRLAIPSAVAQ